MTVVPLPVDATARASWLSPAWGEPHKAVLVVSGLAPTTTELGTYTITAAKK